MDKEKDMELLRSLITSNRGDLEIAWKNLKFTAEKMGIPEFRISIDEDQIFVRVGSAAWYIEEKVFTSGGT